MRFEDYGWEEGVRRLADPWRELLVAKDGDYALSPEWSDAAAGAFGLAPHARILAGFDGDALAGLVPYGSQRVKVLGVPLRELNLAGNGLVVYHQEVVSKEHHRHLLHEFLARQPWHIFRAEAVPVGGPTARALDALAEERGYRIVTTPGDASPYLPITGSWEEYLASRSGNFRYNLRRKEKKLLKAGKVEHRWLNGTDDVEELFRCMLDIEAESWKTEAGVAVTSREVEQRYYRALLPMLAERGTLLANVVYLDGEPVAYTLNAHWNGRVAQMKTTFKQSRGKLSPGGVAIHYSVQRAFELGAREFDFLGDRNREKDQWTRECREHVRYEVFSTRLASRLAYEVKRRARKLRERVRPEEPARAAADPD